MKRRQLNKKIILVILILFISIGFAYLTSNLSINGLATIKKSVWDVHFENITNENENVLTINNPAVISDNKLKIDFEVTLDQPGQEYSFYVDVVNKSTFDVMINNVALTGLTSEQEKWIKNTVTYSDGISIQKYDVLKENSLEVLRVSVKYLDDLTSSDLPTTDSNFSLTLEITFNQKDENAKERNHLEYITRQEEGKVSIGDEIAIDTEHFYVVSSDEDKTVLLTKYNLNVGYNIQSGEIGIQNEKAIGYNSDESTKDGEYYPATDLFSDTTYYANDDSSLKAEYGIEYNNNNIYNPEKSKTSSYVDDYIKILNLMGLEDIKGRLLLFNELTDLGCTFNYSNHYGSCSSVPNNRKFIYSSSYWIGTAGSNIGIRVVRASGAVCDNTYTYPTHNGVRPVIEIPTSYLREQKYKILFDSNGGVDAIPKNITKNYNEKIGDLYYKVLEINDTPTNGYNLELHSFEEINDSESPTGKAYKVTRTSAGGYTGPYWWTSLLSVGDPYYFETTIKGSGTWHIGQEQMTLKTIDLNENDGYHTLKFAENAFYNDNHAIIFYEKSGTVGSYINIAYARLYHLLPETTRNGYTFEGWYTEPDGGTRITHETLATENTIYYAHWTKNS